VVNLSGYTADVITNKGILEGDINFLHKPFSKEELTTAINNLTITNTSFANA